MLPSIYWSKWQDCEIRPECPGAAAYEFRLAREGRPVPLKRFLRIDSEGLLVIGCTGNMDERFQDHESARENGGGKSPLGLLYYLQRFAGLRRRFPGSSYEYRFVKASSRKEAEVIESKLLKQYVCQFGDRPVLNCNLPDRGLGWQEAAEAARAARLRRNR